MADIFTGDSLMSFAVLFQHGEKGIALLRGFAMHQLSQDRIMSYGFLRVCSDERHDSRLDDWKSGMDERGGRSSPGHAKTTIPDELLITSFPENQAILDV
jgi:hypothetical protein